MIELSVSLASNGVVKVPGYEQLVRFGYTKNRGVYRLAVTASGEWQDLTIRAFWHVPGGKDPASSLVVDGSVDVPASVTAQPGNGCITFEGSDGTKTVTSADLRYRVSANSGTEDGTEPEPDSPAWQQLVDAVHKDATAAEQAKTDAQTAAQQAGAAAQKAAASEKAAGDAQKKAADSLQELKDGIAAGNFKGEKGDPGPAGADGKDGIQIDDTAVGPDAWSSKHIVDMLCPPLEETGNPLQCYPVAAYPLGVTASWKPTQEGSGDPSPDNIRPIKGRDSVKVERCGENLLNPKKNRYITYTPYGLTITYLGDNLVHLEGTYQENEGSFVILDSNQNLLAGRGLKITGFTVEGTKQKYSLYGLRTKNETVIAMSAQFTKGDAIDMTVAVVVSGTTPPTEYTPYRGDTLALTLPSTVYGGTVDAVTGEAKSEYLKYTVNGTEEFVFNDRSDGTQYFSATILQIPNVNDIGESMKTELCSHYPIDNPYMSKTACAWLLNQKVNYLRISDPRFSTVEELKAYLAAQYAAGTPVQITYKLAEPVPFTATGAQPISSLSGVNTLLTDADALTVTGRADPIKRIIDLEDAVASMTTT